jgi:predicted GNAT family acetyltransferase
MVRQELEYDPRRGSPEFAAGIRQMIERKLWWVGSADGQLCFFCNVGPWCDRTVQLQGIWTPPAMRRRGLATASLAAICDRLLEVSPTLSLYVNDFNAAAIALYRRVGFEHVGDFQTLLF